MTSFLCLPIFLVLSCSLFSVSFCAFPPLVLPLIEPVSSAVSSGFPYFVSMLPTISVGPRGLIVPFNDSATATATATSSPSSSSPLNETDSNSDSLCEINVGVIRSLEGTYAAWGQEMWPNINLWVSHLSSQSGLSLASGVFCRMNLVICDSGGTSSGTSAATMALLNHPTYPSDFIMAAESALAPYTLVLTEAAKVPTIVPITALESTFVCQTPLSASPPCVQAGARRFMYGHTFFNMANDYLPPYFDQLRIKKAQTVAFFSNTATPWITAVCQAGLQSAVDNGMTVVSNIAVYIEDDSIIASVLPYITQIAQANPDSLSVCTNKCTATILALKQINFTPKALSALACVDSAQQVAILGDDARYVSGPSQWHYHLRGSGYAETPSNSVAIMFPYIDTNVSSSSATYTSNAITGASPLQYYNAFKSAHNSVAPSYLAAGELAALQALEGAISRAGKLIPKTTSSTSGSNGTTTTTTTTTTMVIDREAVNNQLSNYYERSFFGTMSQSVYGYNLQKISILVQLDGSKNLQLISPQSSADTDMIYPMPTWSERVYTPVMFATALEMSAVAVVCIVCFFLILLCLFIFLHRSSRSIRATSPLFSILLIIGAIISCCSTLTWVTVNNQQTCQARMWLLPIGFQLVLGPLLAKTHRVVKIFDQKKFKVQYFTDRSVLLYVFACLCPQLLLSLLWSTVAPLTPLVIVVDDLRPSMNLTTCQLSTMTSTWLALLTVAYCCFSLTYALVLAYRVRKAYAELDESRPIFTGIYMFALITVLMLTIQLVIGESSYNQIQLLFAIRTFGYIIALLSFLFILFGFRIYEIVSRTGSGGLSSLFGQVPRAQRNGFFADGSDRVGGGEGVGGGAGGAGGGTGESAPGVKQKDKKLPSRGMRGGHTRAVSPLHATFDHSNDNAGGRNGNEAVTIEMNAPNAMDDIGSAFNRLFSAYQSVQYSRQSIVQLDVIQPVLSHLQPPASLPLSHSPSPDSLVPLPPVSAALLAPHSQSPSPSSPVLLSTSPLSRSPFSPSPSAGSLSPALRRQLFVNLAQAAVEFAKTIQAHDREKMMEREQEQEQEQGEEQRQDQEEERERELMASPQNSR